MKPSRGLVFLSMLAVMTAAEPPAAPTIALPTSPAPAAVAPAPALTPPADAATASNSALSKLILPPDASKAKEAVKPPPLSPTFQRVRDHMNALFQDRNGSPPTVDPTKNPFRVAGAAPPRTKDGKPAPAAVGTDLTLLQQGAAQLKVNGFVERDGHTLLTINQALYKDGDVIKVTVKGQTVYLRISKLSRYGLTLTLNDAETTLRF